MLLAATVLLGMAGVHTPKLVSFNCSSGASTVRSRSMSTSMAVARKLFGEWEIEVSRADMKSAREMRKWRRDNQSAFATVTKMPQRAAMEDG